MVYSIRKHKESLIFSGDYFTYTCNEYEFTNALFRAMTTLAIYSA